MILKTKLSDYGKKSVLFLKKLNEERIPASYLFLITFYKDIFTNLQGTESQLFWFALVGTEIMEVYTKRNN